jgi:hypothetical protein
MNDTPELERVISGAIGRLEVAGRLSALSLSDQTILMVHGAQGVLDNGGLQYFFESDWPERPAYSSFSDAYRRVGGCGRRPSRQGGRDAPLLRSAPL